MAFAVDTASVGLWHLGRNGRLHQFRTGREWFRTRGEPTLAAALAGATASLVAFAVAHGLSVHDQGFILMSAVVVATSMRTWAGSAATAVGAGLFAFTGSSEDPLDVLLFVAVASAVLVLAGRMRGEQRRLQALDYRWQMLVEQLPVGLYLDLPDATATNVYSNPEIVRMLGYPVDAWVDDPDFFPSLLHPDDRERVLAGLEQAVNQGGRFDELYRLRHSSGEYRWIDDRGTLINDEAGHPLYVQGVLLDVTAEREAESRAASAQRRYESLIHELPLVTYVEDAHELGRTLYISPQVVDFLGYPVERWVDDKDFFFTTLDPVFHGDVRAARVAGKTDTASEYRLIAADGSHRWIDSRRTLVRDPAGEPLYVQGFWVDVTERRELEEQVRRQERLDAIGELSAGLAHNFNNMLMAIRGYAELAANRVTLDAVRNDLRAILDSADRSSNLVHQLLAFSRRQQMEPRPVDLRDVVADLLDVMRTLLGAQVVLRYDAPTHPVIACVDRSQIEQVLVNLALNARDAMPTGGTVSIGLAAPIDGTTRLTITDTGVGISESITARVFDPFFTTKERGTGLGLASVDGMVRQSGGTIRIRNTGPTGTTFEIELPTVEVAVAAA